ncbi:MAG: hypothetical protein OXD46_07590 [Chloroflexi bacterium]|nr:hypothetical protein [Chloroflexota bacterium]
MMVRFVIAAVVVLLLACGPSLSDEELVLNLQAEGGEFFKFPRDGFGLEMLDSAPLWREVDRAEEFVWGKCYVQRGWSYARFEADGELYFVLVRWKDVC